MRKAKKYLAIDLFSGCGGLSLGLERAGFFITAAVEINPIAAETYSKNHPKTALIQSDIRTISANALKNAAVLGKKSLDLLAGCPPCQGFSRIKRKNKNGLEDVRNNLVFDFLRIALELRPKTILLENVPGLAKNFRFDYMINRLESYGYYCDWGILNAADYGVPQRRKRLILMASRIRSIEILKGGNVSYKTVRSSIENLIEPEKTKDGLHRMYFKSTPRIKKLISQIPLDGGSRSALGEKQQLPCHKKTQGFWDVYGRMKWDDVAPTLTGSCINPSKGRFLHPQQNRPISLREAALLQTFPKKYYFPKHAGLTAIARLIGDAIPPLFAQKQGSHLIKHLAFSDKH